jgi:hypothetical protein
MKKLIKNFGRMFIVLNFKNYEIINSTALIIDNDRISKEHLNSLLWNCRKNFANTHIVLLTFEHRRKYIGEEFNNEVELFYPHEQIWAKKYQIAIQMFKERNRDFDYIILTSLDITPIIVALFFTRAQVWLFNQRNQWWSLRQRTVGDLIKIPTMLIWFIFIGARNTIFFLYLLLSVGFFWLRKFLHLKRT